jgi:hypothetical protein
MTEKNCPYEISFEIGDAPGIQFSLGDGEQTNFDLGDPVITKLINDYEQLINKPRINSVEIVGNLHLSDLFADGIVINGGDAGGFD